MLREKQEWTQKDLVVKSGIAERTIRDVEKANHDPTVDTIWRLANAFGMHPKDLLFPSNNS